MSLKSWRGKLMIALVMAPSLLGLGDDDDSGSVQEELSCSLLGSTDWRKLIVIVLYYYVRKAYTCVSI